MADPELPAAEDPNIRLAAKFQSLNRGPALKALGLDPDSPPAELRSGTTAAADLDPEKRALDLSKAMAMFSRPRADAASSPASPAAATLAPRPDVPLARQAAEPATASPTPPPIATPLPAPRPDPNPATEGAAARIGGERTPGNKLINYFDEILKRSQTHFVPIEVHPATLAEYFKNTSKLPFGASFKQGPDLAIERNTNTDKEDLLASGSISASFLVVDHGEVTFHVIIGNSGEGVEIIARDIQYSEKAKGNKKKTESYFDNLISSIIGSINKRLGNKTWEVSGLHIQDGRVRFNFKKKTETQT